MVDHRAVAPIAQFVDEVIHRRVHMFVVAPCDNCAEGGKVCGLLIFKLGDRDIEGAPQTIFQVLDDGTFFLERCRVRDLQGELEYSDVEHDSGWGNEGYPACMDHMHASVAASRPAYV